MSIASVTDLIDILRQHNLLDQDQLAEVVVLQARLPDLKVLVRELVQRGWLTAFQINQVFAGHAKDLSLGQYLLLERLGQGGMGQVFKARHKKMNRSVALKVIRKERLESPDSIRRFQREMHAVAQLSHPNFIHAFDADEVDGTHFIVMEYYDGIDLGKLVKLWGALPVPLACEYIRQTALGLQHAYERGLVHRDIKPSNLLVTYPGVSSSTTLTNDARAECPGFLASGQASGNSAPLPNPVIKILDMGLARVHQGADGDHSTLTKEGAAMGTPDYISPEQSRDSHNVDIRSDLYSLGCAFYYLLVGHVPFPGGTMTSKLVKHQRVEPEPIEAERPEVPQEVTAVVRKLMAKDPEDRYQTPVEVAQVLAGVLSIVGSPVGAVAGPSSAVGLGSGVGMGSGVGRAPLTGAEPTLSSAIIPGGGSTGTPGSGVAIAPLVPPTPSAPQSLANGPEVMSEPGGFSSMLLSPSSTTDTLNSPRKLRRQIEDRQWRRSVYIGLSILAGMSILVGALVWWQLPAGAPPTITFQVAANQPWQDSMVDVREGVPVTIRAEGFWQKKQATKQVSYPASGLKVASRLRAISGDEPYMCVLARIGDDRTVLGIDEPITPKKSGRLFLQANDVDLDNNNGSVTVHIEGGKRAAEPAPPPPPLQAIELKPALIVECGRGTDQEQDELVSPGYGYTLVKGAAFMGWPASMPKTHCWNGDELQFTLSVPAQKPGLLRLFFLDEAHVKRKQKLIVQDKTIGEYEEFGPPGKWVEVPISAADARSGRIDVLIKKLGPGTAVVSTIEFVPEPRR